jgi:TRAP-type C4-dicarboxylate transport system permease small subunit
MVWGGLLGAAVAFHRNRDPKLIHPPKTGPPLWIVTAAILRAAAVVIFLFPVLRHSGRFLTRTAHRTTEALGISTVWVTVSVPVTVVLIFLFLLLRPAVGIVGLSGENGRAEAGAGGENGDVKGTQSAGEPR